MKTIAELQQAFTIDDTVQIIDKAEQYPVVQINNPFASAEIALHGAHIIQYQPENEQPVLWVSDTAQQPVLRS